MSSKRSYLKKGEGKSLGQQRNSSKPLLMKDLVNDGELRSSIRNSIQPKSNKMPSYLNTSSRSPQPVSRPKTKLTQNKVNPRSTSLSHSKKESTTKSRPNTSREQQK